MKFEINLGSERPEEFKVESYSAEVGKVFDLAPESIVRALDVKLNNEGAGVDSLVKLITNDYDDVADQEKIEKLTLVINTLSDGEDIENKIEEIVRLYEEF